MIKLGLTACQYMCNCTYLGFYFRACALCMHETLSGKACMYMYYYTNKKSRLWRKLPVLPVSLPLLHLYSLYTSLSFLSTFPSSSSSSLPLFPSSLLPLSLPPSPQPPLIILSSFHAVHACCHGNVCGVMTHEYQAHYRMVKVENKQCKVLLSWLCCKVCENGVKGVPRRFFMFSCS